jgi:hypothetical protein
LVVVTLQPSNPLLSLQFESRSVAPAAEPAMLIVQPGLVCKVSLEHVRLVISTFRLS